MEPLVIETRELTKKFNKFTAVKELNLKVPKGALYGFLGPNGGFWCTLAQSAQTRGLCTVSSAPTVLGNPPPSGCFWG